MGITLPVFLVCDLLAMSLWAGGFTALGVFFQRDVDRALHALDHLGGWALLLAAVALAIVMARRWVKVRAAREVV